MTLTPEQKATLLKYAKPCLPDCTNIDELPNIARIKQFLETGTLREYFLGPHNQDAQTPYHLLIPYEVKGTTAQVREDFLKQFPNLPVPLRKRQLTESELELKTIYVHVGQVVDYDK